MPTISQTPSVTVSVPVPTPIRTKPAKPRGPVSFGGEAPQAPSQPVQQQPAPTAAIPPMRRQLAGVILPWSPPPRKMARKVPTEANSSLAQAAVKAAQARHSLNPKIARAREMASRGMSLNAIAKELGSTWHAVKKWVATKPEQMTRLPGKVVKYAGRIDISRDYSETPHAALSRFLGGRSQRRAGRTSLVHTLPNGDIAVRLHNTNVVVAHQNGQVTLNHGNYMTPTTRRLMGYANPVIRNVSFAGGRFMIAVPSGDPENPIRWEEYENNTPYPHKDTSNDPVPERGRLTPEQAELLRQHHLTGENVPLGMLGDSLAENGYVHTGALLSRLALNDPGTGGTVIGEYHPQYQQSPELNEHDFHFTPGLGEHDLHELHIEIPRSTSSGTRGQFRVVGSKPAPEKLTRRTTSPQEQYGHVRKVVKFSTHSHELAALLKNARQNPYGNTLHGVIADKLEELMPDSPLPELIREQYGLGQHGGQGEKDVMYHEPFYNSWDGSFPYFARLGKHGPFSLYLGHEGTPTEPGSDWYHIGWEHASNGMDEEDYPTLPTGHVLQEFRRGMSEYHNGSSGNNQRWILHVVSDMKGSRDSGYTFEFPHEEAHLIPMMFPAATSYIHPQTHGLVQRGKEWVKGPPHDESYRNQEAESFDDRMREEEENRTDY